MYSRVTQLEIDTMRVGVDDAVAVFRDEVVPHLQGQDDYAGAYVLATAEGKGILITFWETAEAAADTPFYADAIARYVTLFGAPPGRETYEVCYADEPATAI